MFLIKAYIDALYEAVKKDYVYALERENIKIENIGESKLWHLKDSNGELFFYKFITDDKQIAPGYLLSVVKNPEHHGGKEHPLNEVRKVEDKDIRGNYVEIEDFKLREFLQFLGYGYGDLVFRLENFIRRGTYSITQDDKYFQANLQQPEPNLDVEKIRKIKDTRERLNKIIFTPILSETDWWFYIYGYDEYELYPDIENMWKLEKLLLRFHKEIDKTITVELKNPNSVSRYSYIGEIDFLACHEEVLVLNLYSRTHYRRHINVKVSIATGNSEILLGQYLNIESSNQIISGTVLLEKIDKDKIPNPQPDIYYIPKKENLHKDVKNVILELLHDKDINFRRTPLVGYNENEIKEWLKLRKNADNQKN